MYGPGSSKKMKSAGLNRKLPFLSVHRTGKSFCFFYGAFFCEERSLLSLAHLPSSGIAFVRHKCSEEATADLLLKQLAVPSVVTDQILRRERVAYKRGCGVVDTCTHGLDAGHGL